MAELDLENARGEPVAAAEAFDNKVVGLYFTGRHCPACVRFSPALAAFSEEERVGYVPVVVITPSSAAASPGRDLAGAFAARARYETVRAGSRALTGARGAGGLAPLFFRHGRDAEARRRVKTTRR